MRIIFEQDRKDIVPMSPSVLTSLFVSTISRPAGVSFTGVCLSCSGEGWFWEQCLRWPGNTKKYSFNVLYGNTTVMIILLTSSNRRCWNHAQRDALVLAILKSHFFRTIWATVVPPACFLNGFYFHSHKYELLRSTETFERHIPNEKRWLQSYYNIWLGLEIIISEINLHLHILSAW